MTVTDAAPAAHAELGMYLRRWQLRSQLGSTALWLPRALILGTWLAIALAIGARLWPLLTREELIFMSAAILCTHAVIALALLWFWPHSPLRIARKLERALGLRERLSTALELRAGRIRTSAQLAEYQMRDTLEQAAAASPTSALSIRLAGKELLLLAVSLFALLVMILLPNAQEAARLWQQQQKIQYSAANAALDEARGAILADERISPEERERLLRALDEAGARLENAAISREEAVASLYDAAQQLEQNQSALNAQRAAAQESIAEAAAALRRGDDRPGPDRPATLSDSLQQLREQLSDLSAEQRALLAQALREAADAFAAINPDLASALEAAADALERGDLSAADDALADAMLELDAMEAQQNQAAADAMSMERAANQLEDAAEDLASGDDGALNNAPGEERSQGSNSGSASDRAAAGDAPQGDTRAGNARGATAAKEEAPSGGTIEGEAAGAGDVTSGQSSDVSALPGGDEASGGNDPDGTGRGNYETIYAPRERIDNASQIGIELEAGSSDILVDSGEFSDNPLGEARVPYTQLYREYREAANAALETEYIPLGLRGVVRSYFSALEPAP